LKIRFADIEKRRKGENSRAKAPRREEKAENGRKWPKTDGKGDENGLKQEKPR